MKGFFAPYRQVVARLRERPIRELPRQFSAYLHSRPEPEDPERLRRTLTRLVLVRVVVLTVLLSASAWTVLVSGESHKDPHSIFFPIAIIYAISLLNLFSLKRAKRILRFGYVQLSTDVILSTLSIYYTGGAVSPLIFLYLVVIVGAALILSHSGAVIIAAFSGLCYAALASGLLPALESATMASPAHILAVYVSLVIIALVSGYLSHQLEQVWGLAQEHERKFSELTSQQKQLFDDISEGIITLDLETAILSINKAARSIIGLSEIDADQLLGARLPQVMSRFGVDDANNLLARGLSAVEPAEVTIKAPHSSKDICLSYTVRPLTDREGNESGRILIFNDVSQLKNMEKRLNLHEHMTRLLAEQDNLPGNREIVASVRMIGQSPIMTQVMALVHRISQSDVSVLITGESGTGKELIAKAIHFGGPRKSQPFVAINCGAIPENLIESELFGYKKGAFTGASSDQPGLFRQANGGTIFLDEIGELPPHMQTKLLRVLQEKTVRAVGDVRDIAIDVRVISATNRDLKSEIAKGGFREDLFYRLNVVNVVVPPLRMRSDDIPLLVRHFIVRFCEPGKTLPQISPEALELLMDYGFPGNIRELENIIERAIVLGGSAIRPEQLPEEVRAKPQNRSAVEVRAANGSTELTQIHILPVNLEEELARIEQHYLKQALEQSGGFKKQAAELLGLNFRSFRYRLKKYGMGGESNMP